MVFLHIFLLLALSQAQTPTTRNLSSVPQLKNGDPPSVRTVSIFSSFAGDPADTGLPKIYNQGLSEKCKKVIRHFANAAKSGNRSALTGFESM